MTTPRKRLETFANGETFSRVYASPGCVDAIRADLRAILSEREVGREALVADLRSLKAQFERIAAKPPGEQPHYKTGVRPFGTGDLRHAMETLERAALSLLGGE